MKLDTQKHVRRLDKIIDPGKNVNTLNKDDGEINFNSDKRKSNKIWLQEKIGYPIV